MTSIAITGANGQLGQSLSEAGRLRGLDVHGFSREDLDVTDFAAVRQMIEGLKPATLFNCAAFHQLDACEQNPTLAHAVNCEAVKNMADVCTTTRLVHISTNYVFDGRRPVSDGGYVESDPPGPLQVYGSSKLAGEGAVADRALVVRTAGLYGEGGSTSKGGSFVDRMVSRDGEIKMVADQFVNPTYTPDLAEALLDCREQELSGIVHLVNSGACSWFEFTEQIMALSRRGNPLTAVTTDPLARPLRPLNGTLETSREVPGLRAWQDALAEHMCAG